MKLQGPLVAKTLKTMPVIEFGHLYQPPSVIVPNATQIAFKVKSELLPNVAFKYVILVTNPSSLLIKSVVLIEVCY
jgi:hypothetical protein